MKKVEAPTPCTVTAFASGPAVRTSARTLDSFWSKDSTAKMLPLHLSLLTPPYATAPPFIVGLTKKTSLPLKEHILTSQTASWQGSAQAVQDSNQLWSITNLPPGVEGPDRFVKKRQKLMATRTAAHLPPQQKAPIHCCHGAAARANELFMLHQQFS